MYKIGDKIMGFLDPQDIEPKAMRQLENVAREILKRTSAFRAHPVRYPGLCPFQDPVKGVRPVGNPVSIEF